MHLHLAVLVLGSVDQIPCFSAGRNLGLGSGKLRISTNFADGNPACALLARCFVSLLLAGSNLCGILVFAKFPSSCWVFLPVVRYKPVDPAGSHMLVSKIKPCMSQYKLLYGETANGSLKQL